MLNNVSSVLRASRSIKSSISDGTTYSNYGVNIIISEYERPHVRSQSAYLQSTAGHKPAPMVNMSVIYIQSIY